MGCRTLEEITNQIIDSDGKLKPGFCGIGRLRGKTDYTADEEIVLSYFFTNTHSNVYCATDNMPNELWALVMGQYARSADTGRDRLLGLFQQMHEKVNGPSVAKIAEMIQAGKDVAELLEAHMKKAGEFIDTWGVKYGHASLRDSGTIRICFEGVSQRATKFLESAREGAYQEQSTRALPFTMENLGIPYEVQSTEYENKMLALSQKEIDLYQKIYDKLLVHLNDKFAHLRVKADEEVEVKSGVAGAKLSDREWNGIIAAKAFDVARYMLPQNMTTSLGVTLNTRRFMDQLSEWQSSELMEMRVLGRVAQAESMLISPMLMKHGNRSDYHAKIPAAVRTVMKKHVGSKLKPMPYKHYDVESRLIHSPEDFQELVLASILLNQTDGGLAIDDIAKHVKTLSFEQKREIAEAACAGKDSFEIFSKIMECGAVVFERLYDIGAFRDLQRQRGDRQQYNRYGVVGYNMPKEVEEIGLKSEFVAVMEDVKALYDEMIAKGMHSAAQYVPVMANLLRHVVTKDPVQCFYEAKLRSQPAGIDSYRTIAIQEIEQLLDKMPAFKGLVPYTPEYHNLGRLPEAVRMCTDRWKGKAEKKAATKV